MNLQTFSNRPEKWLNRVIKVYATLRNNGRKLPFFQHFAKNRAEIYQIDSRFLENFYPAISGVR